MANLQPESSKKVREKSALYPAVTISDCYEFIKKIDSLGGSSVAYASIAELMGLTSLTTKSFLSRISASKQYGLITTKANTAQLTDLAKRILYPTKGDSESYRLLVEAFQKPPLYEKLIKRFDGKSLPQKTTLSNILMNEYQIIKQVKDNAAECFIESATYLELLKNGMLLLTLDASSKTYSDSDSVEVEIIPPVDSTTQGSTHSDAKFDVGYNFEIPTLGKKTAKFYIPDGVTETDLDYIKLYIEKMLPVFIDNLKRELTQE